MAGAPTGLYDAATDLLNVAAAALGGLAPERRYVSVALPALDCKDQLTVHPSLVLEDDTLGRGQGGVGLGPMGQLSGPSVIIAELTITVAWCITTPESETDVIPAATLDAEGASVASGGWALWNGVRSALRAGVLFNLCDGASVSQLAPLLASGAMAGWTLAVRTQLDGYDLTWQT